MSDQSFGCAALLFPDHEEVTEVTKLLRDFDSCIEASTDHLKAVERKADRLERQLRSEQPTPDEVRKALRDSRVPVPPDGEADDADDARNE